MPAHCFLFELVKRKGQRASLMGQVGGEHIVTEVACVRLHIAAMFRHLWMFCFAVYFRSISGSCLLRSE